VTEEERTPESPEEQGSPGVESAAEVEETDSPGAQPDADTSPEEAGPRTSEGGPQPEAQRSQAAPSTQPQSVASPQREEESLGEPVPGRPLLVFLNEVAGGRKLLRAVRERAELVPYIAVVAPQNHPAVGQLIDTEELYDAARARVEVTMAVFAEFGIDSVGDVMDRDPLLALDDAVRAYEPGEVLLSCLPATRVGITRKDLVEWARTRFEPEVGITLIPVRIEDDAIRWDVIHTLVVATRTVDSPDLVRRLIERHRERPHRYTFICPRSGEIGREEVGEKLASTLAALYREEIDATGQPMSPDPFHAVQNAIHHYRVDEILISTLAGEQSKWLEEDLIGRVREITDKPVEHIEAGRPAEQVAAAVAGGEPARS
jgi:hypothetical protein